MPPPAGYPNRDTSYGRDGNRQSNDYTRSNSHAESYDDQESAGYQGSYDNRGSRDNRRVNDTPLGKRRRRNGDEGSRSTVVQRESITSDNRRHTAEAAGQNEQPCQIDTPRDIPEPRPLNAFEEVLRRSAGALSAVTDFTKRKVDMILFQPKPLLKALRDALEYFFAHEPQKLSTYPKFVAVVGEIHEILVPAIYADWRPAPEDNPHIMPSPEGTKTIFKICPAVVTSTNARNTQYKVLTSKHNTDHSLPQVQRDLGYHYVYMNRVDESGAAIDNSAPMPTRYDHLNFIGVPDYDWTGPSYFLVAQDFWQPNGAPRRKIGSLFDWRQRAKMLIIKREGYRRADAALERSSDPRAPQAKDTVASQVISLVFHKEHLLTTVV
jgi:hypothetical protein